MTATKKKAPKGKPGKTSVKTIRAQVNAEFLAHAGGTLNAASARELTAIFDATIGKFAKSKKKDVWRIRKFKKFILLAAKRIGKEVASTTGNGSIDKAKLRKAAVKVMRKMDAHCPVPAVTPTFKFKKSDKEGQVCLDFLAANAGL